MKIFTYQKATYNSVNGWFAVCRINGVYSGQTFGSTKKAARLAWESLEATQ